MLCRGGGDEANPPAPWRPAASLPVLARVGAAACLHAGFRGERLPRGNPAWGDGTRLEIPVGVQRGQKGAGFTWGWRGLQRWVTPAPCLAGVTQGPRGATWSGDIPPPPAPIPKDLPASCFFSGRSLPWGGDGGGDPGAAGPWPRGRGCLWLYPLLSEHRTLPRPLTVLEGLERHLKGCENRAPAPEEGICPPLCTPGCPPALFQLGKLRHGRAERVCATAGTQSRI